MTRSESAWILKHGGYPADAFGYPIFIGDWLTCSDPCWEGWNGQVTDFDLRRDCMVIEVNGHTRFLRPISTRGKGRHAQSVFQFHDQPAYIRSRPNHERAPASQPKWTDRFGRELISGDIVFNYSRGMLGLVTETHEKIKVIDLWTIGPDPGSELICRYGRSRADVEMSESWLAVRFQSSRDLFQFDCFPISDQVLEEIGYDLAIGFGQLHED